MAIDGIAPETTMDRSCSASASDTSRGDGEDRPEGDEKKGKTTEPGAVCLKPLLMEAPPGYLTLSLRPGCPRAAAKHRRRRRPEEVSLAYVETPRDYLSLSLPPSDQPKRRRSSGRGVSGGGGSGVADASSVAPSGTAVVVGAELPPPPVQIPATCLPPKKRNLAAAGVHQEAAGTALASSSSCLALAIVNNQDLLVHPAMARLVSRLQWHPTPSTPSRCRLCTSMAESRTSSG